MVAVTLTLPDVDPDTRVREAEPCIVTDYGVGCPAPADWAIVGACMTGGCTFRVPVCDPHLQPTLDLMRGDVACHRIVCRVHEQLVVVLDVRVVGT